MAATACWTTSSAVRSTIPRATASPSAGRGEHPRREFPEALSRELTLLDRECHVERPAHAEVRRDDPLQNRSRGAPLLRCGRRAQGKKPDRATAGEGTGQLAEPREPRNTAVRGASQRIDAAAADDGNTPALGAGAERGFGVIADVDALGESECADGLREPADVGWAVSAREAEGSDGSHRTCPRLTVR